MIISIERDWAGKPLLAQHGQIVLRWVADGLHVQGWARCRGGEPVPHPPGRAPKLWEHEVLELFLLGADDHYLELEFGPDMHWLALRLHGERKLVSDEVVLDPPPTFTTDGERWSVTVVLPPASVPAGLVAANACAIVGRAQARKHMVWRGPAPGHTLAPDFHALRYFGELDPSLR